VHDLPDYVFFNHSIHVNKGIGCATCHGRVDQMPVMYGRIPAMEGRNASAAWAKRADLQHGAWKKPASDRPAWCAVSGEKSGLPTAEVVDCVTKEPMARGVQVLRCSCIACLRAPPLRKMRSTLFSTRSSRPG